LSRLVFKELIAYVSEARYPNTANSKSLVQKIYVVGDEYQTKVEATRNWHPLT
jgi:hypothetical protein